MVDGGEATTPIGALLAVLVAAVRGRPVPPDAAAVASADPEAFTCAAARGRVLPVVATAHRDGGLELPEWAVSLAGTVTDEVRDRQARCTAISLAIAEACDSRGLRPVFRKGVHLLGLYPDPTWRPFNDVDVLIAPEQADELDAVLEDIGAEAIAVDRRQAIYLAVSTDSRPGFFADGLPVDPATSLTIPALADRWSAGRRIGRSDVATQRGHDGRLPLLTTPWLLVDLVINTYIGCTTMRYVNRLRFQRLNPWLDLLVVAAAMTDADWRTYDGARTELGLDPAHDFVLAMGSALLGPATFLADWPGHHAVRRPEAAEEYGELEFGAARTWTVPLARRMVADGLPEPVPAWQAPL